MLTAVLGGAVLLVAIVGGVILLTGGDSETPPTAETPTAPGVESTPVANIDPEAAWAGDAGETPWLGNVAHEVPLPSAFCVALPRSLLSGRNVPREPAARAQWLARRAIRWYEKGQRALYTPFSALFVHAAHVMKDNERPEHARGLDAE